MSQCTHFNCKYIPVGDDYQCLDCSFIIPKNMTKCRWCHIGSIHRRDAERPQVLCRAPLKESQSDQVKSP